MWENPPAGGWNSIIPLMLNRGVAIASVLLRHGF